MEVERSVGGGGSGDACANTVLLTRWIRIQIRDLTNNPYQTSEQP
jgi:hypothetical protein